MIKYTWIIIYFFFRTVILVTMNFSRFIFHKRSCPSFLCEREYQTRISSDTQKALLHTHEYTNVRTNKSGSLSTYNNRGYRRRLGPDTTAQLTYRGKILSSRFLFYIPTVCKQIVNGKALIVLAVIPFPLKTIARSMTNFVKMDQKMNHSKIIRNVPWRWRFNTQLRQFICDF